MNALNFSAPEAAVAGFGLPFEAAERAAPPVGNSFVVCVLRGGGGNCEAEAGGLAGFLKL